LNGPLESFTTLLKDTSGEKMLRYDAAYMLGMVWQSTAPPATLDILKEFLEDEGIKLYQNTATGVEGIREEGKGGKGNVKVLAKGDGRTMAVDALNAIGVTRIVQRADIMKQLRFLANSGTTDPLLKSKASALVVKTGQ